MGLYPLPDFPEKGLRSQDLYGGTKGQYPDEHFGFIHYIVLHAADKIIGAVIISGPLFKMGELNHASFQGIAFLADLEGDLPVTWRRCVSDCSPLVPAWRRSEWL